MYHKKKAAAIGGMAVSSLVPFVLLCIATMFFAAGTASTIYEDTTTKYSLWRFWNKTTGDWTVLQEEQLPCPDFWVRVNAGRIYYIATLIFATVALIVNLLDLCGRPLVSKGHGILIMATFFVGCIAWIITTSLMSNGACDDMLAPVKNPGMQYGASQPVQVVGTIIAFVAGVLVYVF